MVVLCMGQPVNWTMVVLCMGQPVNWTMVVVCIGQPLNWTMVVVCIGQPQNVFYRHWTLSITKAYELIQEFSHTSPVTNLYAKARKMSLNNRLKKIYELCLKAENFS